MAAGTRAVHKLKQVITALRVMPVGASVNIPFVAQFLDDGVINPNDVMNQAASDMLDELLEVQAALKPLRTKG